MKSLLSALVLIIATTFSVMAETRWEIDTLEMEGGLKCFNPDFAKLKGVGVSSQALQICK